MKKLLFAISIIFIGFNSFGSNAELFSYDKEKVNSEFKELNELEKYVVENNFPAITDIKVNGINECNLNLNVQNSLEGSMFDEMDWTAFAWGFCCCPVGFFVVAVNPDKDNISKKSYWIGVIVNVVSSAISQAILMSSGYYYTY